MQNNIKDKLNILLVAIFSYLLIFSTRTILLEYPVLGTSVINDFTKVFLFGADLLIILLIVSLFWFNKVLAVKNNAIKIFGLFLLWLAISGFFAEPQTFLFSSLLLRLIFAGALFYLINQLNKTNITLGLALGLIVGSVFQSLVAIFQFGFQKSLGLYLLGESTLKIGESGVATFSMAGDKLLRAYGTLPHPNILAFYLVLGFLAVLAIYQVLPNNKKLKRLTILSGLVIFVGLLLTFSRIFIFFGLLSSFIFLYYHVKNKRIVFGSGLILVAVFIGLMVIRPINTDTSYSLRTLHNNVAVEQVKNNLISGVGLGQSVFLNNSYLQKEISLRNINEEDYLHQPAHNFYLLVAAETGIVGLFIFIFFLYQVFINRFKNFKQRKDLGPLALFISISSLVILVGMFFEHMFFTSPNVLYLSFIIFALAHIKETPRKSI